MFRRPFNRRPFVRPIQRAVRPDVHPLLARANQLMAAGNFPAAAQAYEQLAFGAQQRGIPRDAHLYLQAGRCRILAGQVEAGLTNLTQGLEIFARRGNLAQLKKSGELAIADLKQRNLTAEAAEIENLIVSSLPAGLSQAAETASPPLVEKSRLLPTSCPSCGGPLRPGEVEWLDEATGECPYCGGAIRAE